MKKVSQSRKRGEESLIAPKNWKGGPFWVLHFKVEAFGCVQNQVLSTFGKSEYFTKSGTYAMSEKSDEKKDNKTGTSKVGAISRAQKAQSFLNMPRTYSGKALKTLSRHPKCAFHARYDWKITFPDWKQKKIENFFENFF